MSKLLKVTLAKIFLYYQNKHLSVNLIFQIYRMINLTLGQNFICTLEHAK
jgi:hypothetical protein